jgi:hypothetical protein
VTLEINQKRLTGELLEDFFSFSFALNFSPKSQRLISSLNTSS